MYSPTKVRRITKTFDDTFKQFCSNQRAKTFSRKLQNFMGNRFDSVLESSSENCLDAQSNEDK
ncbi:hypothetical protein T08_821 [Trichinella sp. T8]|nr:hypothetical protein T08_821 [Trichinella sp. T8]